MYLNSGCCPKNFCLASSSDFLAVLSHSRFIMQISASWFEGAFQQVPSGRRKATEYEPTGDDLTATDPWNDD